MCYYVVSTVSTDGLACIISDSKVHGANMGPIWGRQDPGGPHVGPMNFAIWDGVPLHMRIQGCPSGDALSTNVALGKYSCL